MEEEIIMVPGDEYESIQEKFMWGPPMVKLLIDEFKKVQHEFSHSNVRKKNVWRKIAQSFAENGYQAVTEEMCDKKWRNLKKTFKEIYVGQRHMNSKTRWPYYSEVEEIFGKDPNIINAASTKPYIMPKKVKGPNGMRVELMEVVGNLDEEGYLDDGETAINEDGEDSQFWTAYESPPPQQEPPAWFSEFLQQYRADEEKRMDMLCKMHADIMAVEERKCSLLTSLIEKLGGSESDSQEDPEGQTTSYYLQLHKDETDGEIVSDN